MKYVALKDNILNIYGTLGKYEEVELVDIAEKINNINGKIEVRINSEGGDIFTAHAIYNLLKEREVEVKIDGMCASAATLIACAGGKVSIAKNALYVIHEPKAYVSGFMDSNSLMKETENLEKVKETLIIVYEERTKKEVEELREMIENEKAMTAKEAVALGFCDEVIDEIPTVKDNPISQVEKESGVQNIKSNYQSRMKEEYINKVAQYANKGVKYNGRS